MTIYDDMIAAGEEVASHYSDLYVKDTPEAWAIFDKYKDVMSRPQRFISNTGEGPCLDFAFAFDPYWDAKRGTHSLSAPSAG